MRRQSLFFRYGVVAMLVTAAMVFTAIDSQGQTTGEIYGTVTDISGGVIPGANVEALNSETNLTRTTFTDDQGGYRFTLLPVGTYSVSVTLQGFATTRQDGVEVHATEATPASLVLEVGQVAQEVIVTALTPQVDVTTSSVGKVVEEQRIVDLPLNGRNFLQLGTLQSGVVAAPVGIQATGSGTDNTPGGTANQFSVNGMKITSNNHLLDGTNNVEAMSGSAMVVPSPDTIQEFRILTNNYTAEYGRAGGSVVTVVTKSGTNAVNGTLYEFLRNDALDARNFFVPEVPTLKQNQFGGTIGGPIVRDRTFFFGGYEGFRQRKGRPTNTLVPSLKLRNGDFSDLPEANRPHMPFEPGTRWPDDVIPMELHDPVSRNVLDLWPLPNSGPDNWVATPVGSNDRDQFMLRIDHSSMDGANMLTGRYFLDQGTLIQPNGLFGQSQGFIDAPGFGFSDANRFQNLTLADTHIFGASVINEFRFAHVRARVNSGKETSEYNNRDFGFTYPTAGEGGEFFPAHAIAPYSGLGYPVRGNDRISRTLQFSDNVSVTKGRHSLKFGVDVRRYNILSDFPSTNHGNFNFNDAGPFGFAITGIPYADFLLGQPSWFLQTAGASVKELFKTDMYLYVHDTFRINPRFTLNWGLRYELSPGFLEKEDRQFALIPGVKSTVSPTLPEGVLRPGDPGVGRRIIPTDKNNFGPRLGLSWDLTGDGRTSLRAGGGIFFDDSALISTTTLQQPPELQAFYFVLPALDPTAGYAAPFGGASPIAGDLTPPLAILPGLPVTTLAVDMELGNVGHWNLTLQRQLTEATALEVAYVGNSGWNLNGMTNPNQAVFGPDVTRATANARRPIQGLTDAFTIDDAFHSSYHGLQTTLTRRFSGGLSFQAAYTWSRAIDNASTFGTFFNIPGQPLDPGHAADLSNDKGLSAFHLSHRLVLSYIYELPFLRDRSDALSRVLGGWRINGIMLLQSGSPFTVLDRSDQSFDGTNGDRPNLIRDPNNGPKTPEEWFDTGAFVQAEGPVMNGTAGRNIVLTDGIVNFDFGLTKMFDITEGTDLEFRWEAFNLFNNVNFGVPKNDLHSDGAAFGQVLRTSTDERIMQFGLKFIF